MTLGRWLVTGGAGYIGAHVVRTLRASGGAAVVVDDLSTGDARRVPPDVDLEVGTVVDAAFLTRVLQKVRPTGVIHLAGKKSPTESMADPELYARENVGGVIGLLRALRATDCPAVVFSSSCSVYGAPDVDLVDEDAPTLPVSPYGDSKLYGERILNAAGVAHGLGVVNLRYFNVVGAASPELRDSGEYNLIPRVFGALRSGTPVSVHGDDYPTDDGTCVRDYVDVEDLAAAHVRAAEVLAAGPRMATYNVGRSTGSSVLEVLDTVAAVAGMPVPREIGDRRPGDPARIVGRAERISRELGWTAQRTLRDMVRSAWEAERQAHALV